MRTLLPDPPPAELQTLLERRKRLGQDRKDEVLIVDPESRQVHWLGLTAGARYEPIERSGPIEIGAAELARRIDWP